MNNEITQQEKFFIAGSSGMVGSSIIRTLKEKGYGDKNYGGEILAPKRNELDLLDLVEVKQIKAKIKEINFDKRKTIILSPVKGKVFNLIPQSIGYASTLGENLMNIVPDGDVEAKVFLSNNDVGFVKNQMEADIRVDAYPFTQFGSIKGKLKFVGDEVLPSDYQNPEPRFPAYISLSEQFLIKNGNTYEVRSGQSVSVNLKVRDKPVITLLTDSIDRALDSLKGIKN